MVIWAKDALGENVLLFKDAVSLFASKTIDAIIIGTPHYDHSPLAIQGFENNLHVLTEKPAGVYTKQVREINQAASKSNSVFGIMYNQRTNPLYEKLRDLIKNGELGEIRRTNWIITNWYRSEHYYNSGGWRATWGGEGGIMGLTLSNAMLLSAWTDNWVELPMDEDLFYEKLKGKINTSTYKKETVENKTFDLKNTYK